MKVTFRNLQGETIKVGIHFCFEKRMGGRHFFIYLLFWHRRLILGFHYD